MLQKLRWWPNRRPSRSSGLRPFSIIEGVPHSEVMTVSWLRCHQHVVAEVLVAAVVLPGADDVEAVVVQQGDPAGAVVAVGPAQVDMKMPPGPQWTVWGRE